MELGALQVAGTERVLEVPHSLIEVNSWQTGKKIIFGMMGKNIIFGICEKIVWGSMHIGKDRLGRPFRAQDRFGHFCKDCLGVKPF